MQTLKNLFRNEDGVTALEYGLFAALIAAIIVTTVGSLGQTILTALNNVLTAMGG